MNKEEFGKYLKSLRKAKKLTIKELAKESSVSHPYISQFENGHFMPSPEILTKLSGPLEESPFNLMIKAGHININEETNKLTSDLRKTLRKAEKWLTIDGVNLETNAKLSIEYFLEKKNIKSITTENLFEELEKYINKGVPYNDEDIAFGELFDRLDYLISKRELASLDISDLLENATTVSYKGHKLADQDRERVSEMLKLLFPQYN